MILLDASFIPDDTSKWVVIGLGVFTLLYVVLRPSMRKKDPLAKAPGYASLSQQRAVEKQMSDLLVELSEMSRQITAQLDTRAAKLELLIREADEKIARLQSLGGNGVDPKVREEAAQVVRAVRRAESSSIDLPENGAAEESNVTIAPAIDPRHVEVYRLADRGRSPVEIAQELHRPSGEIELILALRPKG